ncbi:MAG: hypothetical protein VX229_07450 [Pseudomonadota bacterium]|nr:hypothetical protein [Pseudomonadota bacterium]
MTQPTANKRRPGERGRQMLPTQADRRRWLATLKQRADDGDADAIAALLSLDTGRTA